MKFILVADDKTIDFFPLSAIVVFFVLIMLLLYGLYPRNLLNQVLAQEEPSAVTLSYLKGFKPYNADNLSFMVSLIEQEIGMNQLNEAKADIDLLRHNSHIKPASLDTVMATQMQWLNYLMNRAQAAKAASNTKKRIIYLQNMRTIAASLLTSPLKPQQFKQLAHDMLALGKPAWGLQIYKQLFAQNALTTANDLAEGGAIAMQNNAQKESSFFYWSAYQIAPQHDKKQYALAAIKALWAGNFVKEAVALADQLPKSLIQDKETLIYLSQLALAANQPQIAERYMLKALSLSASEKSAPEKNAPEENE